MTKPEKKVLTPFEKRTSASFCLKCNSCCFVPAIVFIIVGSLLCQVNRKYCCTDSTECPTNGGSGTSVQSYGPCGDGSNSDDNDGFCTFYCGDDPSEAFCDKTTFSCPDITVISNECVPADTCCASAAGTGLLITGSVIMAISGILILIYLCAYYPVRNASPPNASTNNFEVSTARVVQQSVQASAPVATPVVATASPIHYKTEASSVPPKAPPANTDAPAGIVVPVIPTAQLVSDGLGTQAQTEKGSESV